jgi:Fic family protein
MRTYERTHPWITFLLDLRRVDYKLWLDLGEAQSQCEHISGVPLQPLFEGRLLSLYLAKGVQATTAIEGNTLSEQEVLDRIEGRSSLPPSREYLGREVDNIIKGCNEIKDHLMRGGSDDLNAEEIKTFNKIVLEELTLGKEIVPGEIRKHSVGVAGYRGAPAEDCEYLLERMCEWLNGNIFKPKDNRIVFGILRAMMAHLYIAWIHPFGDGNGRTARLLEVKILLASGVPAPAAHLLSNHYNQTRNEYYRQLGIASESKGDVIPFIQYALQGLIEGLRSQLDMIQMQQLSVAWRDFVYEHFRNKSGSVIDRRRRLVLDLSTFPDPVPLNKLHQVSPRVAESYAGKTLRTIRRDVAALMDIKLIKRKTEGYIANKEIMRAFLPERRDVPDQDNK